MHQSAEEWKLIQRGGKKYSPETEDEAKGDHEEADDNVHGEKEKVNGVSEYFDEEEPTQAESEKKETDTEDGSEEETKKCKRVPSKKSPGKRILLRILKPEKLTVKTSSLPPKNASSKPSLSGSKVQDSDTSPKM
ncbi:hypothetical protein AgCh_007610 [Apium graveolens]